MHTCTLVLSIIHSYKNMAAIQKTQCITKSPKTCQPITFKNIGRCTIRHPCTQDDLMMWATCCIAFFGLLRVSKFTAPTQSHFNSSSHLSLTDVALDSRTSLQVIRITLKQSKTDQLRQGTHLYLRKTGRHVCPVEAIIPYHVCPVEAIIPYLIARGNRPAPPFLCYKMARC